MPSELNVTTPLSSDAPVPRKRIGEDVSEKLDYTLGVFEVERHIRGKWVCRRCERLIQAPVPCRQEAIFGRAGLLSPAQCLPASSISSPRPHS
jgi:hypothetical protein